MQIRREPTAQKATHKVVHRGHHLSMSCSSLSHWLPSKMHKIVPFPNSEPIRVILMRFFAQICINLVQLPIVFSYTRNMKIRTILFQKKFLGQKKFLVQNILGLVQRKLFVSKNIMVRKYFVEKNILGPENVIGSK